MMNSKTTISDWGTPRASNLFKGYSVPRPYGTYILVGGIFILVTFAAVMIAKQNAMHHNILKLLEQNRKRALLATNPDPSTLVDTEINLVAETMTKKN